MLATHSFAQPLITSINVGTNADSRPWLVYDGDDVKVYWGAGYARAVTLTFPTRLGFEYCVESKLPQLVLPELLDGATWYAVSPTIYGTGATVNFKHGIPGNYAFFDIAFYRIAERPANSGLFAHGLDLIRNPSYAPETALSGKPSKLPVPSHLPMP